MHRAAQVSLVFVSMMVVAACDDGGTAGRGSGGAGGRASGSGGATAGSGGSAAGTGGSAAGTGGNAVGSGGSAAGTGGSVTGTGGGSAGAGGGAGMAGRSGTGGVMGGGGRGGGAGGGRGGAGGGRGGAGGGLGGISGSGGATAVTCPAAIPTAGEACAGGISCFYEDCAGAGRTIARCVAGSAAAPRWTVTTAACTTVTCPNPSSLVCQPGQICVVRAGGAFIAECATNSCGTSAVSCGCLQSCLGECSVVGSAEGGVVVTCNTCPSNLCP